LNERRKKEKLVAAAAYTMKKRGLNSLLRE
jgi:hypothetical protein